MKRFFTFCLTILALIPLLIYAWWPEEELK